MKNVIVVWHADGNSAYGTYGFEPATVQEAVAYLKNVQGIEDGGRIEVMAAHEAESRGIAPFCTPIDAEALEIDVESRTSVAREVALAAIMTPAEIEAEFGLGDGTVRQAIGRGQLPARKADERTWLVLRSDAEARWGYTPIGEHDEIPVNEEGLGDATAEDAHRMIAVLKGWGWNVRYGSGFVPEQDENEARFERAWKRALPIVAAQQPD